MSYDQDAADWQQRATHAEGVLDELTEWLRGKKAFARAEAKDRNATASNSAYFWGALSSYELVEMLIAEKRGGTTNE